jgi:antitoxin VapB
MYTGKLFMNGRSQAVRLPRELRMSGKEVFIKRVGSTLVLIPKESPWDTLAESLDKFSDDFMEENPA